jgi:hypothetical protein
MDGLGAGCMVVGLKKGPISTWRCAMGEWRPLVLRSVSANTPLVGSVSREDALADRAVLVLNGKRDGRGEGAAGRRGAQMLTCFSLCLRVCHNETLHRYRARPAGLIGIHELHSRVFF